VKIGDKILSGRNKGLGFHFDLVFQFTIIKKDLTTFRNLKWTATMEEYYIR